MHSIILSIVGLVGLTIANPLKITADLKVTPDLKASCLVPNALHSRAQSWVLLTGLLPKTSYMAACVSSSTYDGGDPDNGGPGLILDNGDPKN
jgi:hypothetical protein